MLGLACEGVRYWNKEKPMKKLKLNRAKLLSGSLWTKSLVKFFSHENSSRVVWTLASPEDVLKDSSRVPKITLGHSFICNNRYHKLFLSSPGRGGMGMRGRGRGRIPMGPPGVPGMPPTGEFPQGMDERYPFLSVCRVPVREEKFERHRVEQAIG